MTPSPKHLETAKEICPFCLMFKDGQEIIDIEPLNPVAVGHRLIIPRQHVSNFSDDPDLTAGVMRYAAEYTKRHGIDANLITSKGSPATQSVFHLHVHIVPRREGDGLLLPWTGISALQSLSDQHEKEIAALRERMRSKGDGLHFAGLLQEEKGVKEALKSFDQARAALKAKREGKMNV